MVILQNALNLRLFLNEKTTLIIMIKKEALLFAVIGYPIAHSLSPKMHNPALRELGINGRYMPMEIKPDNFEKVFSEIDKMPLRGFNVTVPFKERIIPFMQELSPEAKIIGAVNTVSISEKIKGYNTDADGFYRSLQEDLNFSAKGKKIVLLGAGGAARACIYALAEKGAAQISILNRTAAKAEALAAEFSVHFSASRITAHALKKDELETVIKDADLVVNTTSVGLKESDSLLVETALFELNRPAVYDLIYNPAQTKLLESAKKAGCKIANGKNMLLFQGAKALEIWTGKEAPVETMRQALFSE